METSYIMTVFTSQRKTRSQASDTSEESVGLGAGLGIVWPLGRNLAQSAPIRDTRLKDAPLSGRPSTPKDESGSSAELLPHVYDELRRLARARIAQEPAGLTLQPTALVHEAYLRLAGDGSDRRWDRRGHFFGAAAIAMRRILVERARHYRRIKHGGEQHRVELDNESPGLAPTLPDVLAIDQALTRLEQIDAQKARIVLLRYFAGLTIEETAAAMDLSPATVKNEWAFARSWLHDALGSAETISEK
jgi:RNA polymerase sigma factor (TIGR02999 family)